MKKILVGLSVALNLVAIGCALYLWRGDAFRRFFHPTLTAASVSFFEAYPIRRGDIVVLGDSITAGGQWSELFPGERIRNRGIGGDRTEDLLARFTPLTDGPAEKLFIKIGTNDLGADVRQDKILSNYGELLDQLAREIPSTRVYIQSVLPRAGAYRERVEQLNQALASLAKERGLTYIDLYPAFLGDDGSIRDDLTYDELHLSGAGYREWQRLLAPYVSE